MSWLTDPNTTDEELEANAEIARQTQAEIAELWRKHNEKERDLEELDSEEADD